MKVTLEQLRNQIAGVATDDDYMLQGWIAAIDAHLTQPAQSVDVEKVREVIAELRDYNEADDAALDEWADKLTAALQEKGNG